MIAIDPNATFTFGIGTEPGVVFVGKHLPAREYDAFVNTLEAANALTGAASIDKTCEAIGMALVSIDGQTPSPSALGDMLTLSELWDVAAGLHKAMRLDEEARKKSGSPSHSAAAETSEIAAEPRV